MTQFFLDNLWRWKCGLPELDKAKPISIFELGRSEWSDKFESLMRNRLILGAMRYGKINAPDKPKYNRIEMIRYRLGKYVETGNTEFLVDCANACMLEFIEGSHPDKHFRATEEVSHCKIKR